MVHKVTAHYISDRFLLLFKRLNAFSFLALLITATSALFVFYSLNQLRLASEHRLQSYTLSEELRSSSDQLTKMARAYAVTGNAQFKDYFYEVLAIRSGERARPKNYHRVYWDFRMPGVERVEEVEGRARIAFDQLLHQLSLTKQERWYLAAAKLESDALTVLENTAFDKVAKGDNAAATDILYSKVYFKAKAKIMQNINEFHILLENRSETQVSTWLSAVYSATFIFILSVIILLALLVYKSFIRSQLDGSILTMLNEEVDEKTAELSKNNDMLKDAIVELKSTQKQLIEAEKMSLLGRLVTGVAHEINTPVGVSITAISSQKEDLKILNDMFISDEVTKQYFQDFIARSTDTIDITMNSLYRVVDLVKVFKKLAVDQNLDDEIPIVLRKDVDDVIDALIPSLKNKDLKIINKVEVDLEFISYAGAIAQVLTNIIRNCDQHAFETQPVGEVVIHAELKDNNLRLTITDNGQGMPEQAIKKIFDPFFSYHKKVGGTGLGMNIVYAIVTQKLNGDIHCSAQEGEGTQVMINFPVRSL